MAKCTRPLNAADDDEQRGRAGGGGGRPLFPLLFGRFYPRPAALSTRRGKVSSCTQSHTHSSSLPLFNSWTRIAKISSFIDSLWNISYQSQATVANVHKLSVTEPSFTYFSLSPRRLTFLLPRRESVTVLTSLKHDLVTDSAPFSVAGEKEAEFRLLADSSSLKFDIRYFIYATRHFQRNWATVWPVSQLRSEVFAQKMAKHCVFRE